MSPGEAQFKLTYEVSPIFMTGGIAGSVPGATVPLISYTEGNLFGSLLSAGLDRPLDNFFANFRPAPGSTLINNAVGKYPFANQSVAANAIIVEPLRVSMLMTCPARRPGDFRQRQAILTSLKQTLDAHVLAGGTFTIATPSFLYTDCVLLGLSDVSGGETNQPQYRYQFDFEKPLITQAASQQSYNNLMSKIGSQTQLTPDASGEVTPSSIGNAVDNPGSGAAPSVVPPTQSDPGMGWATFGDAGSSVASNGFTPSQLLGDQFSSATAADAAAVSPSPAGVATGSAADMNIPTGS